MWNPSEICRHRRSNEDAAAIAVPAACCKCNAVSTSFAYVSLETVHPSLGQAFEDYAFRDELRMAGRRDLATMLAGDRLSSVQGTWRGEAPRLTEVLKRLGTDAPTGPEFLRSVAGLALPGFDGATSGHWMDIVGLRDRNTTHAWHQDAHGRSDQLTVMLGFPARDYVESTTGVFSHVVKLSHEMHRRTEDVGPCVFHPDDFGFESGVFPDDIIIKPTFRRGQEILVYSDASTLHSAPDLAHRDSIWRFM